MAGGGVIDDKFVNRVRTIDEVSLVESCHDASFGGFPGRETRPPIYATPLTVVLGFPILT